MAKSILFFAQNSQISSILFTGSSRPAYISPDSILLLSNRPIGEIFGRFGIILNFFFLNQKYLLKYLNSVLLYVIVCLCKIMYLDDVTDECALNVFMNGEATTNDHSKKLPPRAGTLVFDEEKT